MIPAGTILTIDLTGSTSLWIAVSPTDARAAVLNTLTAFFLVNNFTLNVPSGLSNALAGDFVNTPYTATVTITTRVDYAQADDAGSVVANAFYQELGAVPTFSVEGYDAPQQTGITTTGPSLSDGLTAFLQNLESELGSAAVLLVGGIVVIVAVIAFSPTGRTAAGRL